MSRFKKLKKKKKSTQDSLMITITLLIAVPLCVLLFVYFQSSLMQIILVAQAGQAARVLGLPANKDCLPYSTKCPRPQQVQKGGGPSFLDKIVRRSEFLSKMKSNKGKSKPTSACSCPAGSTIYNVKENKLKGFLDSSKYGKPYTLIGEGNWILDSIGKYFATYWITLRSVLSGLLEGANGALYENFDVNKEPKETGDKFIDFGKFVIVLPLISIFMIVTHTLVSAVSMFVASIINQFLFIPLLIILSIIIFAPLSGITSMYLFGFLLKPDKKGITMKLFRKYGKRYKYCWAALTILIWVASIGNVWEGQNRLIAMCIVGIVPTIMLFLSLMGFTKF